MQAARKRNTRIALILITICVVFAILILTVYARRMSIDYKPALRAGERYYEGEVVFPYADAYKACFILEGDGVSIRGVSLRAKHITLRTEGGRGSSTSARWVYKGENSSFDINGYAVVEILASTLTLHKEEESVYGQLEFVYTSGTAEKNYGVFPIVFSESS